MRKSGNQDLLFMHFSPLMPLEFRILPSNLEDEFVWSHSIGQGESGTEILLKMLDFLDVFDQLGVKLNLLGLLLSDSLLFFFRLLKI